MTFHTVVSTESQLVPEAMRGRTETHLFALVSVRGVVRFRVPVEVFDAGVPRRAAGVRALRASRLAESVCCALRSRSPAA